MERRQQDHPSRKRIVDGDVEAHLIALRCGVANIFMFTEPLGRWRRVSVTEQRTRLDWAEQYGDFIVVTSGNPRTEKPEQIIQEVITGFKDNPQAPGGVSRDLTSDIRHTKIVEPDRKKAIQLAIETAEKDDIVLIAGKGHETYQILGKQKFHFSDKEIAYECLKGLK